MPQPGVATALAQRAEAGGGWAAERAGRQHFMCHASHEVHCELAVSSGSLDPAQAMRWHEPGGQGRPGAQGMAGPKQEHEYSMVLLQRS